MFVIVEIRDGRTFLILPYVADAEGPRGRFPNAETMRGEVEILNDGLRVVADGRECFIPMSSIRMFWIHSHTKGDGSDPLPRVEPTPATRKSGIRPKVDERTKQFRDVLLQIEAQGIDSAKASVECSVGGGLSIRVGEFITIEQAARILGADPQAMQESRSTVSCGWQYVVRSRLDGMGTILSLEGRGE